MMIQRNRNKKIYYTAIFYLAIDTFAVSTIVKTVVGRITLLFAISHKGLANKRVYNQISYNLDILRVNKAFGSRRKWIRKSRTANFVFSHPLELRYVRDRETLVLYDELYFCCYSFLYTSSKLWRCIRRKFRNDPKQHCMYE